MVAGVRPPHRPRIAPARSTRFGLARSIRASDEHERRQDRFDRSPRRRHGGNTPVTTHPGRRPANGRARSRPGGNAAPERSARPKVGSGPISPADARIRLSGENARARKTLTSSRSSPRCAPVAASQSVIEPSSSAPASVRPSGEILDRREFLRSRKRPHDPALGDIPQAYGTIAGRGGQLRAIGCEDQSLDCIVMPVERGQADSLVRRPRDESSCPTRPTRAACREDGRPLCGHARCVRSTWPGACRWRRPRGGRCLPSPGERRPGRGHPVKMRARRSFRVRRASRGPAGRSWAPRA